MYWNNVETQPGMGYPRDCQNMGGGFDEEGALRLGRQPTVEDYGIPWEYNVSEALLSGTDPWMRPNVKPTWGPNWDEDEGEGDYPNSYYFYLPRLCNHCANPARRQLFRHLAQAGDPAAPHRAAWRRVTDIATPEGTVLWSGGANSNHVVVVGDEGSILHFDGSADAAGTRWGGKPRYGYVRQQPRERPLV